MGISTGFWGGKRIVRRKRLDHTFGDIISLENLCLAWEEFLIGKKKKRDVIRFSQNLMDNIVELHEALVNYTYRHGGYESFFVNDPKRRHIHKASVRDRLLHHAVHRILYPFFDRTFSADSFSCRLDKGTHKAVNRFQTVANKVGHNNTTTGWVLKGDIRKFFASIDHKILLDILGEYIPDNNIMGLLREIVGSFEAKPGMGLPLGNLTSQIFANVYLNIFDQWIKHRLKVKYYIRYADDFVILSPDKKLLVSFIPAIKQFLAERLRLELHAGKIFFKTLASGVDFLGWVNFPQHRVLRQTTRRRMFARLRTHPTDETLQSYLGLLGHGNTLKIRERLLNEGWLYSQ